MPDTSTSTDGRPYDDFDTDYVNEAHIEAFARALEADEYFDHDLSSAASPLSPGSPPPTLRVRKVSALSDFAPINQKVSRRRRRTQRGHREWSFHLVRWPLLGLLFLVIFGQFGLYVFIRQVVNVIEWLFAWRGRKGILRKKLRSARTYEEWKAAAETMDEYLGFDAWKKEDEDPFFDWLLVKKVRRSLKSLREKDDVRGVLGVLEVCIRANFAGTESSRLYSETFYGTKDLVESYINEVEAALAYIRTSPKLSIEEKRRFFRSANRNFGASALCLSGGASFGYYHFGVARAFLDANLLPRVIAGTSAGGLVAAFICTRTDDELRRLMVPKLADKITACEEPFSIWFKRFLAVGARFDTVTWARKAAFFTRGSLTFREAYELTGRVLNISVIPFDRHSPTKLLNYLTAPDCVIWSAIIASAAVPGILNPVVLMQKTKSGTIVPWSWGSRFKDGSLRVDVPLQSLNLLFNVNHPVVSQVNPHVHLFFFAPRGSAGKPVAHRKGKGWRGGFLLSAAEQFLKHELTKNFKVIRDLELLPQLLGQDWSSVFLQRFDGSVTIWPRTRFWDWIRILSDPDPAELDRMIHVGQMAAWPKLHMVDNRFRLEREILRGRKAVRAAIQARTPERPTVDIGATTVNGQAGFNAGEPSTATRLTLKTPVPFPTVSVEQLPIESDAERGFASGTRRFFKHSQIPDRPPQDEASASGTAGDVDDPLSSPIRRRRWASSLLERGENSSISRNGSGENQAYVRTSPHQRDSRRDLLLPSSATSPPPPRSPSRPTVHERSPSFLERLRNKSFPSFGSPFASFRKREVARSVRSTKEKSLDAQGWSSDSSSEDEYVWNQPSLPTRSALAFDTGQDMEPNGDATDEDSQRVREELDVNFNAQDSDDDLLKQIE